MSELANYSVETDQLIWLAFKDGRNLRVSVGQLPRYLAPRDLQRVRLAIKLRRDFFRQNMPRALVVLLGAVVLAGLAAAGGQALAHFWAAPGRVTPAPPGEVNIVRSEPAQGLSSVPASVPAQAAAAPAATLHLVRPVSHRRPPAASEPRPEPTLAPLEINLSLPAVSVTPLPLPVSGLVPTDPLPLPLAPPSPTPTPTPPADATTLPEPTL